MDRDLLQVTLDDLNYLATEWKQDIDDSLLRITSPILRNLLIYDNLKKAATDVGQRIRIMTPAIYKVISEDDLRDYVYWQCGGAVHKGMMVMASGMKNRAISPEEIKSNYEREKNVIGKSYPIKLESYLKQPSFVVDGEIIPRATVIKYVCNKLGGTHYDPSRDHGREVIESQFVLLDKIREQIYIADKNAIFFELLSIGQRVINSRDVRHLKKQLINTLNTPPVIHA